MNRRFHPWLAEIALGVRNRIVRAQHDPAQTLFHATAWATLAALAVYGFSRLDGDRAGVVIRLLLEQPLVPVLLFAAFGFVGAHICTATLLHDWRHGWWGALPIASAAVTRTLWLVAALFALAQLGAAVAALLALAAIAEHWRAWLAPALACAVLGLPLGAFAGYATTRRNDRIERQTALHIHGSAQPLFILPWIESPHLPNTAHWQRCETLRVWRRGGRGWPFLLLGAIVPMNEAPASLAGLLLLGGVLIWFGTALRAASEIITRADAVLAATPHRFRDFAAATARYPLLATVIAMALGGVGLLLQDARWPFVLAFGAMMFGIAALQLAIAWRHRRSPARAGLRFAADLALIIALGTAWLPLAPIALAALVVRHYRVAGNQQ